MVLNFSCYIIILCTDFQKSEETSWFYYSYSKRGIRRRPSTIFHLSVLQDKSINYFSVSFHCGLQLLFLGSSTKFLSREGSKIIINWSHFQVCVLNNAHIFLWTIIHVFLSILD